MKAWFAGLEQRERLMVGAGGAAAAIIILWGFIWMPLRGGSVELRETVAEKRVLLVDLQRAEALSGGNVPPQADQSAGQSLVVLVDRTAQPMGLAGAFTRTRPDGADAINVTFSNAAFDNLLTWLVMLEQSYGISVESASFNGSREQGLVNGQILLRRR